MVQKLDFHFWKSQFHEFIYHIWKCNVTKLEYDIEILEMC